MYCICDLLLRRRLLDAGIFEGALTDVATSGDGGDGEAILRSGTSGNFSVPVLSEDEEEAWEFGCDMVVNVYYTRRLISFFLLVNFGIESRC